MESGSCALDGRAALVTGAAEGIGRAIAEKLAQAGADVALLDVNEVRVRKTAQEIAEASRRATLAVPADVSRREQVKVAVGVVLDEWEGLDILVNNAGIWRRGSILETTEGMWDEIFAVNVKGVLFTTQAVLPSMMARRSGKIINIASMAGLGAAPDWGAYGASKAAVISLTQTWAEELREHHVQVCAVCPGATRTSLTRRIEEATPGLTFDTALPPAIVAQKVLDLVCPFEQTTTGEIVDLPRPGT